MRRSKPTIVVEPTPADYQPVTAPSCRVDLHLVNPNIIDFINNEARDLGVPFDIAVTFVLARGINMLKATRVARNGDV